MAEEWMVYLKDSFGFRHSIKVNADNQPDAIAQAKAQFKGYVDIRRVKRLLNDDTGEVNDK